MAGLSEEDSMESSIQNKFGGWRKRLVLFLFLCWTCLTAGVSAAEEERETVRVGYYLCGGFQELSENGVRSGYVCDYLKEISRCTAWKYEIVFEAGSFDGLREKLRDGEIDLMCGISQTPEYRRDFYFSEMEAGRASYCLCTGQDDRRLAYEEFLAFDGIKVGVLRGDSGVQRLSEYCRKHGFSADPISFETEEQMQEALQKKSVDALLLSTRGSLDGYRVIARFAEEPYYFAISRRRPELKEAIDASLEEIHAQDSYFHAELYSRNYTDDVKYAFTREELKFLEKTEPISVAMYTDLPVLSCWNEETEQFEGAAVGILNRITELSGLRFAMHALPSGQRGADYMKAGSAQMIVPMIENNLARYSPEIYLTDSIFKSRQVLVGRPDFRPEPDGRFTIALQKSMFGAEQTLGEMYPNAEILLCENVEAAYRAVYKEQADVLYDTDVLAQYRMNSPYYKGLAVLQDEKQKISFCVLKENQMLASVLEKCIDMIPVEERSQILLNATLETEYEKSPAEYIYAYRGRILAGVLAGGVCCVLIVRLLRYRRKIQNEREHRRFLEKWREVNEEHQRELYHRARYDSLTGIFNREAFLEQTNEMLKAHPEEKFVMLRLNLERFKLINNMYGNEVGDAVLRRIGKALKDTIYAVGTYGRFYADQFAACYPERVFPFSGDEIRSGISNVCVIDGREIRPNIVIGVCMAMGAELTAEKMADRALLALQKSGSSYQNQVCMFCEEMLEGLFWEQTITNEMVNALHEGQFEIYLQPQYHYEEKRPASAEVLVRWKHPTFGEISPGQFIPVFEKNGFIYALDCFIWEEACRLLQKWEREGLPVLPLSVNISRMDLYQPDLTERLAGLLKAYGISAKQLHLEITETAYMDEPEQLILAVKKLRSCGFRVEMDDFGSGFSSLNMLKDMPVDVLKLDMRFLEGDGWNNAKNDNILSAVMTMAQQLNLLTIAEGVERQEQAQFMYERGCMIMQGYFYGKPMPAERFENEVLRHFQGALSLQKF